MGAGQRRTRLIVAGLVALVLAVGRFRSVVIWCRRFPYAFGAAELSPAR